MITYISMRAFLLCLSVVLSFFISPQSSRAENLKETASFRLSTAGEFNTGIIDASLYKNIDLSIFYDATTLDFGPPQDSFSYGYRISGSEYLLGTVLGLAGSTTAETGYIDIKLPSSAEVANLEVFISLLANSSVSSDKVELRNIILTGESKPVIIDVCSNIGGAQEVIPSGYQSNESSICLPIIIEPEPIDICPNISGVQLSLPIEHQIDTLGNCVPIPLVITDVCPNLPNIQPTIPSGYEFNSSLDCVEIIIPPITPPATTTATSTATTTTPNPNPNPPKSNTSLQCPRGFSKWIDRFNERHVWRADDVYQAIILVGGPTNRRQNRDKAHFLYIAGPTEVGDKYYRRFHKITQVCVRG